MNIQGDCQGRVFLVGCIPFPSSSELTLLGITNAVEGKKSPCSTYHAFNPRGVQFPPTAMIGKGCKESFCLTDVLTEDSLASLPISKEK